MKLKIENAEVEATDRDRKQPNLLSSDIRVAEVALDEGKNPKREFNGVKRIVGKQVGCDTDVVSSKIYTDMRKKCLVCIPVFKKTTCGFCRFQMRSYIMIC